MSTKLPRDLGIKSTSTRNKEFDRKTVSYATRNKERIYMLAYDTRAAAKCAEDNNLKFGEWTFINDIQYMRGLTSPIVWLVKGFHERNDLGEIFMHFNWIKPHYVTKLHDGV